MQKEYICIGLPDLWALPGVPGFYKLIPGCLGNCLEVILVIAINISYISSGLK